MHVCTEDNLRTAAFTCGVFGADWLVGSVFMLFLETMSDFS